ncbi:MAG: hypothetical protein JSU74_09105 [Candidatus Zixiibacteriota bacterium]|nr:MAG: hypothetical protein JSU74_09105 [candidate division Zixibacteria bacterium]
MKQITLNAELKVILTVIVVAALAWGCSDRVIENHNQVRVPVKMETTLALSEMAQAVNLVCLTITAADMEPVVSCQVYDGNPVTFDLEVPAGPDRRFTLEGIAVTMLEVFEGDSVIYRGSTVTDIEPNVEVTLTIQVEPVVPLFRFTPSRSDVASGQSFTVAMEIFNIPNLRQTDFELLIFQHMLFLDSVVKGATLDAGDVIDIVAGDVNANLQVTVTDPNTASGAIVDSEGYSHLATLYLTANLISEPMPTPLVILPTSFTTNDGSVVLVDDVFSQTALVNISSYTDPLIRLVPQTQDVASGDVFALNLEGFNLDGLRQAQIDLVFDPDVVQLDSIAKGATLGLEDIVELPVGAAAATILISDPNTATGSIVNSDGYSQFATLYFTTNIRVLPGVAEIAPGPVELLTVGGSIPVSSLPTESAFVNIAPTQLPVMKLIPSVTTVESPESFSLDVELYNFTDLSDMRFYLDFDYTYMHIDSVQKGLSLDTYDTIYFYEGAFPGTGLWIYDGGSAEGTIVESDGSSLLATIYFSTEIINIPVEAFLGSVAETLITVDGGFIPTTSVVHKDTAVSITEFQDAEVTFLDFYLDLLIRDVTGISSGPIMRSDVYLITSLNAQGGTYFITDLTGIEELVNLTYIDFNTCGITDLTPLSQLPVLHTLNLNFNNVSDISPLANITSLRYLYLVENDLLDTSSTNIPILQPLSSLTGLVILDLHNRVDYPGNSLQYLSPLSNMNQLTTLDLGQVGNISDVTPLQSLASITNLILTYNNIEDIAPLANGVVLTSGDVVNLDYNPLSAESCGLVGELSIAGVTVYANYCGR